MWSRKTRSRREDLWGLALCMWGLCSVRIRCVWIPRKENLPGMWKAFIVKSRRGYLQEVLTRLPKHHGYCADLLWRFIVFVPFYQQLSRMCDHSKTAEYRYRYPAVQFLRTISLSLRFSNPEYLSLAHWTHSLCRRPFVLQGDCLWILYFPLGTALNTIRSHLVTLLFPMNNSLLSASCQ